MSGSPATLAYGSWPSPITAAKLVEGAAAVGELRVDDDDIWWSETRPSEGGRTQLVRRRATGTTEDVLPAQANARTRVHEYGGGAWCVAGGTVFWVDWSDQRVRSLDARATDPGEPVLLTPEPPRPNSVRYADLVATPDRRWIVCVRESHGLLGAAEAVNELVAVPADGSAASDTNAVVVLVSDPDFVSSPRISADGRWLAWTQWHHPDMPWDGTELWAAGFGPETAEVIDPVLVAGGRGESIVQPEWVPGPTGDSAPHLLACSDRTGWWNLYRWEPAVQPVEEPVALAPLSDEIGGPQWVFGLRWYTVLPDGSIAGSASRGGDSLALVEPGGSDWRWLDLPYTSIEQLATVGPHEIAFVGAGPCDEPAPIRVRIEPNEVADPEVLRPQRDLGFGPEWISVPEHITFESTEIDGRDDAHALLYAPHNPNAQGPDGELPPLLVLIHGGPTSAARLVLQLGIQFWTSRGFAVVDVNYRGSTGYGRPYRDALKGGWGIVDVDDCVAAAKFLAEEGEVDPERLAIRGGSAGGFTTLAALARRDTFAAGASRYGVADLGALATDTHKFESRYLDALVGPWPEAKATYDERSPINHVEGFDKPLLVLQGDEDEVVPPAQSQMIVDALAAKGVPHAYLLFEGEQHGFRQAENIVRSLEAELWFYGRVFGFDPADEIVPVEGAAGL